jgi:hypothetical protein
MALKVRAYYGDKFWNVPNIQEKIEKSRKKLEESSDEMNIDNDIESVDKNLPNEIWTKSLCININ